MKRNTLNCCSVEERCFPPPVEVCIIRGLQQIAAFMSDVSFSLARIWHHRRKTSQKVVLTQTC